MCRQKLSINVQESRVVYIAELTKNDFEIFWHASSRLGKRISLLRKNAIQIPRSAAAAVLL